MIHLADLAGDAPVVRGGASRDPAAILESVLMAVERTGRPVLSVFIVEITTDFDEAVAEACRRGPVVHGKVQVATVRDLVEAGFVIADERTEDESDCHFHVYFPQPLTQSTAQAWLGCFDPPVPNPAGGRRT